MVIEDGMDVLKPSVEENSDDCGRHCSSTLGCNSFSFCEDSTGDVNCFLMDKLLSGYEKRHSQGNCSSFLKHGAP